MRTVAIGRVALALFIFLNACSFEINTDLPLPSPSLHSLAVTYIKLELSLGKRDSNYVDAYYGTEAWKPVWESKPHLEDLGKRALLLLKSLQEMLSTSDEMVQQRRTFLSKQVDAMIARNSMIKGNRLDSDSEAQEAFDAHPPYFQARLQKLEPLVPGEGPLAERLEANKEQWIIPSEQLDRVFQRALKEARERSLKNLILPDDEQFQIAYVTSSIAMTSSSHTPFSTLDALKDLGEIPHLIQPANPRKGKTLASLHA